MARGRYELSGEWGRFCWRAPLDAPKEIGYRLDFSGEQPEAFFLSRAFSQPIVAGSFVGDTRQGGSVNCRSIQLTPHGNGTHTECVGHLVDDPIWIHDILRESFFVACLLTVPPRRLSLSAESYGARHEEDDQVITAASLVGALGRLTESFVQATLPAPSWEALILRTEEQGGEGKVPVFSGKNPPYLSAEAMGWILSQGTEHLLLDLPSVDREEDEGTLPNHRRYWGIPRDVYHLEAPPSTRTITELLCLPSTRELPDGMYLLELQIPAFCQDAAPSRPRLYPLFLRPALG